MRILASSLNPEETYKLMTGVVVPRPIAWITSQGDSGAINAAPFSCYTIVAHKPPMIGVNIGKRAGGRKDPHRPRRMGDPIVQIHNDHIGRIRALVNNSIRSVASSRFRSSGPG